MTKSGTVWGFLIVRFAWEFIRRGTLGSFGEAPSNFDSSEERTRKETEGDLIELQIARWHRWCSATEGEGSYYVDKWRKDPTF